eukprot:4768836-Prymnesium_polylepis.1
MPKSVWRPLTLTNDSALPHAALETDTMRCEPVDGNHTTGRIKYNTKCWYYMHSTCTRGKACPFLHEEDPVGTVFYDGSQDERISQSPEPETVTVDDDGQLSSD